jgi:IMP dehydrogenase/GMP reductase
MLIDFNDILITPAPISKIRSRKDINPHTYNIGTIGWLPVIVSPMDTVISIKNWKLFIDEKMPICFPRGIKPSDIPECDQALLLSYKDVIFFSYSLDESSILIKDIIEKKNDDTFNILIDIANGNMSHMIDILKELKSVSKNKIMVGNIANPETYRILSEAGADYIRCGIGFGGGCLTSMNVGIGYPMASLIKDCYDIKVEINGAKIVADGGFREYSDIIKGLALGADFIMLGSILNKSLESAGDTFWSNKFFTMKVGDNFAKFLWKKGQTLEKKFRGMSTKEVQKEWGRKNLKTSEGVVRMRTVKYTLSGWRINFEDYLKSTMSYTNSKTLNDFIGRVNYTIISQNTFNRFLK